MVDRVIAYPGALPQTVDVLNAGKFGLVGQAYQNRAILGTNTVVSGLTCTPTSPTADLHVTIGVGSIYQMDPTDAVAYGDLGVDNNNVVKQGILASPAVLTITPPGTAGFSQVFLVQAILSDVDAGQMVLSYYNSANPASPYSGPANSGTSNFTIRTNPCAIALKAGVAATTGTQTTPTPDVGYVGLYAVTVANGQTQITSPNIVQQPTAPFFPTLPSVPAAVLNGSWVYAGQDTGAANAYVITFAAGQAVPTAYVAGMGVKFKALVTNTGASTINVNGLGVVAIRRATGVALSANDINSGGVVELTYDGTLFQMQNYLGAAATTSTITNVFIPYVADTGTANALIGTYSPAITSGQQIAGLFLSIKLANNITGASTINVNGLGVKSVLLGDLQNPLFNVFLAGEVLLLCYDGTQYQVVNTSSATYRKPIGNTTIFVNNSMTGASDSNDGVSNTANHTMLTIQGGVNKAFSYAPSQFMITVVVEPGTYNESVSTPSYAGPNLTIDGLIASSVLLNSGGGMGFSVSGPNTLTVKNVTVQNNGLYPVSGFIAGNGATMSTVNTASNTCGIVFDCQAGATLTPGNHTFNGSGYCALYALYGAFISLNACTFTFSTAISFSGGFAVPAYNATIGSPSSGPAIFINPSFVSGNKFNASFNGTVATGGLGVNFFPGTLAGVTSNGGQAAF
jgi:hypothetical protein